MRCPGRPRGAPCRCAPLRAAGSPLRRFPFPRSAFLLLAVWGVPSSVPSSCTPPPFSPRRGSFRGALGQGSPPPRRRSGLAARGAARDVRGRAVRCGSAAGGSLSLSRPSRLSPLRGARHLPRRVRPGGWGAAAAAKLGAFRGAGRGRLRKVVVVGGGNGRTYGASCAALRRAGWTAAGGTSAGKLSRC